MTCVLEMLLISMTFMTSWPDTTFKQAPFLTPQHLLPYIWASLPLWQTSPLWQAKENQANTSPPRLPTDSFHSLSSTQSLSSLPFQPSQYAVSGPKDTLENLRANFPIEIHSAAPRGPHCHKPCVIFILCLVRLQSYSSSIDQSRLQNSTRPKWKEKLVQVGGHTSVSSFILTSYSDKSGIDQGREQNATWPKWKRKLVYVSVSVPRNLLTRLLPWQKWHRSGHNITQGRRKKVIIWGGGGRSEGEGSKGRAGLF